MELNQSEQQKEKRMKMSGDSLRGLWDNIKRTNIHNIRVPEGGEREKGAEILFKEIMAESFLNLRKERDTQFQQAQSSK